MDWKQIEGKWNDVAPEIQRRWDRLSADEVRGIAGDRDRLVGKLREKYHLTPQDAEKQVEEFRGSLTAARR